MTLVDFIMVNQLLSMLNFHRDLCLLQGTYCYCHCWNFMRICDESICSRDIIVTAESCEWLSILSMYSRYL